MSALITVGDAHGYLYRQADVYCPPGKDTLLYIYLLIYMDDGVWMISGCIMVSIFMFSDMIFRVKGRRKMGRGFLLGFRGDEGVPLHRSSEVITTYVGHSDCMWKYEVPYRRWATK